ncbi:MAG: hypothetical protein ACRCVJ_11695 [Clostridium sp.]|uniref:hypothetical protein n=1 Tax=Clostridium sp. TaxID=1506 RepID=UPI003F3D4E45
MKTCRKLSSGATVIISALGLGGLAYCGISAVEPVIGKVIIGIVVFTGTAYILAKEL